MVREYIDITHQYATDNIQIMHITRKQKNQTP